MNCISVHGEWHSDRIIYRFSHTTSEDYATHSSYLTTRELSYSLSTRPGYKLVLGVKGNKTHLAEVPIFTDFSYCKQYSRKFQFEVIFKLFPFYFEVV